MFRWQLPPFLVFGIYMTFIHPLFRRSVNKWDEEYFEDEIVKRVKRRIEVRWGLYCIFSLLIWIAVIAALVVVIVKTTGENGEGKEMHRLSARWIAESLRDSWKVIY